MAVTGDANISAQGTLSTTAPPSEVESGTAPAIIKSVGIVANANIDTSDYFLNGYGVVGLVRGYDRGFLPGDMILSYDEFATIARTYTLISPYVIATAPPPDDILKGDNVGTWLLDYKFVPATGVEYVSLNNSGVKIPIDIGYGRLTIYVKTADGKPYKGDRIYIEELDRYIATDSSGKAVLDAAGTYTIKVLKESKSQVLSVTEFVETVKTFYFAGLNIKVVGTDGSPIENILVSVDNNNYFTDGDGYVRYYEAPVTKDIPVQVFDIVKSVSTPNEGQIIDIVIGGGSVAQISGKVVDELTLDPVVGVIASVENVQGMCKTNVKGLFSVILGKSGKYRIKITGMRRYEDVSLDVNVTTGKITQLDVVGLRRVAIPLVR